MIAAQTTASVHPPFCLCLLHRPQQVCEPLLVYDSCAGHTKCSTPIYFMIAVQATARFAKMSEDGKNKLVANLLQGLPGTTSALDLNLSLCNLYGV